MTDDELLASFEAARLPAAEFHHRDHVHVAFLYLCRHSALEAIERFSSALKRFAIANGKPNLYNETVTWAFVLLIRERMARAKGTMTWPQFEEANADLLTWRDNILKKYYREETLASDLAKNTFLFPDKTGSCAH